MSLFRLSAPCPIFAPVAGESDVASLVFQRAAHLVDGRAMTVNSAGETVLSFVDIGAFVGELQPQGGSVVRMLQGIVVQIDAMFYILGAPNLQAQDRCTVDGAQLEIVSTQQYGQEHAEIALRHMGR